MAILNGTSGRDTLAGTSAADTITGLEGADFIDGRAGADRMEGGAGNDVYVADNIGDAIIERPGEGVDEVRTTLQTYVLGANVESLSYTGTVGSFTGVGNELVNIITGGAAADLLDGGAGGDRLIGGLGNDTYVVDDRNDRLFEGTEGGIDTAWSHLAGYALAANVEILVGRLQTAQRLVGNTLENEIYGQSGRDLLDGAAGADRMTGGAGNDTYVVDNADDSVVELAREGVDTVLSSVSYRLADYVECLTLTGGSKISATGNSASNILTGNAAANILDGGTGADRMSGGAGNDTYVVDNVSDRITELAGEGVDTVLSSVSYTLGDYVERLALTGEAAANGTGNGASNVLTGNAAANTLSGGAGNDRIHGGFGNDSLYGGSGSDYFYFDTALDASGNVDRIFDFHTDDTIMLSREVFSALGDTAALAASAFVAGTAAMDADDRIVYDAATGNIFYDADGSGSAAAILFANLAPGTALTSLDFAAFG